MAQVSAYLAQVHTLMAQVLKLGIFDVFAKFWCQCVLKLGILAFLPSFWGTLAQVSAYLAQVHTLMAQVSLLPWRLSVYKSSN